MLPAHGTWASTEAGGQEGQLWGHDSYQGQFWGNNKGILLWGYKCKQPELWFETASKQEGKLCRL